jgi:hypothetical protein
LHITGGELHRTILLSAGTVMPSVELVKKMGP